MLLSLKHISLEWSLIKNFIDSFSNSSSLFSCRYFFKEFLYRMESELWFIIWCMLFLLQLQSRTLHEPLHGNSINCLFKYTGFWRLKPLSWHFFPNLIHFLFPCQFSLCFDWAIITLIKFKSKLFPLYNFLVPVNNPTFLIIVVEYTI